MRAQTGTFTIRELFQPTKVPAQNSSDKARSVSVRVGGPAQLGRCQPCAPRVDAPRCRKCAPRARQRERPKGRPMKSTVVICTLPRRRSVAEFWIHVATCDLLAPWRRNRPSASYRSLFLPGLVARRQASVIVEVGGAAMPVKIVYALLRSATRLARHGRKHRHDPTEEVAHWSLSHAVVRRMRNSVQPLE